jgi:hypothetical protein
LSRVLLIAGAAMLRSLARRLPERKRSLLTHLPNVHLNADSEAGSDSETDSIFGNTLSYQTS